MGTTYRALCPVDCGWFMDYASEANRERGVTKHVADGCTRRFYRWPGKDGKEPGPWHRYGCGGAGRRVFRYGERAVPGTETGRHCHFCFKNTKTLAPEDDATWEQLLQLGTWVRRRPYIVEGITATKWHNRQCGQSLVSNISNWVATDEKPPDSEICAYCLKSNKTLIGGVAVPG